MVLGMSLHSFTVLHVVITLVELFAGAVVVLKMIEGRRSRFNGLFLITGALTTLTGFLFPYHGPTPARTLGFITLPFLLLAAVAWYTGRLRGVWRVIYVISAVLVLYFDAFVAVAQAFLKIPALHALAPEGKEPPFQVAQGLLLLVFLVIGYLALRRFRPTALVDARA
jgi:hypothetical protein